MCIRDRNAVAQLIKKLGTDKCQLYTQLNSDAVKGQIVLAGDSLIENFMIPELYHGDKIIYNRGIAGNLSLIHILLIITGFLN